MVRAGCPCLSAAISMTNIRMIYASIIDFFFFYLHSFFSIYASLEISVADQLILCVIVTDIAEEAYDSHSLLIFSITVILSKASRFVFLSTTMKEQIDQISGAELPVLLFYTSKYQKFFEILTFAFIKAKIEIINSLKIEDSDLSFYYNNGM